MSVRAKAFVLTSLAAMNVAVASGFAEYLARELEPILRGLGA